jgi:hypothetical protein
MRLRAVRGCWLMPDLNDQERKALEEAFEGWSPATMHVALIDKERVWCRARDYYTAALAAREEPPDYDPAQDDRPFDELTRTERIARQHASFHRQLAAVDRELQWEGTGRGRIESIRLLLAREDTERHDERRCTCPIKVAGVATDLACPVHGIEGREPADVYPDTEQEPKR